jgi:ribosome-associated translation inhibitor RaiA
MTIQFNSAHNVYANEKLKAPIIALLSQKLNRFSTHISRLDVHLSDENGNKEGLSDKKCLLEAHVDGMQPIVAKSHAETYHQAAEGAVDILKVALNSTLGRAGNHHQQAKDSTGPEVFN